MISELGHNIELYDYHILKLGTLSFLKHIQFSAMKYILCIDHFTSLAGKVQYSLSENRVIS